MNMRVCGLLVCMVLSACSWENTAYEITRLPDHLDLRDHVRVEDAPRWRLASSTSVALIHNGAAPDLWQQAAQRGMASVLHTRDSAADVHLKVFWPRRSGRPEDAANPDRIEQHRVSASVLGLNRIPRPAAGQSLTIHALDAQGVLLHSMTLHIDPSLWGDEWRHEQMLESAFAHLADVLQGG